MSGVAHATTGDLREAAELLRQHVELLEELANPTPESLLLALTRRLLALLRGDVGHLTQLLYRIDVSEPAVAEAFGAEALEDVALALAELVLARELRTVALRRSLGGQDDDE